MSDMSNLFNSVVIPFPAARSVGRVRRVSNILLKKQGRDADAYWRRQVLNMTKFFNRAGIPVARQEAEIHAFFRAVQIEVTRMAEAKGMRSNGEGAA